MPQWECAMCSNPQSGDDTVQFSHPQSPGIVHSSPRRSGGGSKPSGPIRLSFMRT